MLTLEMMGCSAGDPVFDLEDPVDEFRQFSSNWFIAPNVVSDDICGPEQDIWWSRILAGMPFSVPWSNIGVGGGGGLHLVSF